MKPDFVIISSRLNKLLKKRYSDQTFAATTEYMVFFPQIEDKIHELFGESGLALQYRGKTKNIFPSTVIWGQEGYIDETRRIRSGEISVIEQQSNKKVAQITLNLFYDKSLKLVSEPEISIKEL